MSLRWVDLVDREYLVEERKEGIDDEEDKPGVIPEKIVGNQNDEKEKIVGFAGHEETSFTEAVDAFGWKVLFE